MGILNPYETIFYRHITSTHKSEDRLNARANHGHGTETEQRETFPKRRPRNVNLDVVVDTVARIFSAVHLLLDLVE